MISKTAYAKLNARIDPVTRGDDFEIPLKSALEGNGYAQVMGGGTMLQKSREISYCGIDLELIDIDKGVPFICQFLEECGAPKGSILNYENEGRKVEVPFGRVEGLAILLNGTELSDSVYQECDLNFVVAEINRLLGDDGEIRGYWQGETGTALYLYGASRDRMKNAIAPFVEEYPLCHKSKIEVIA